MTPAAAGNHTIGATFAVTTVHTTSNDSKTLTVNTRHTTSVVSFSINPVVVNQATAVTVTVTDDDTNGTKLTPTGTIALTNSGGEAFSGPCTLSGNGASASCTVNMTPAAAGNHTIGATFAVTTVHTTSNDSKTLTVNTRHTTSVVSFSINPVVVNQATAVTVTVTDDDT